jgi:hypothetical protein
MDLPMLGKPGSQLNWHFRHRPIGSACRSTARDPYCHLVVAFLPGCGKNLEALCSGQAQRCLTLAERCATKHEYDPNRPLLSAPAYRFAYSVLPWAFRSHRNSGSPCVFTTHRAKTNNVSLSRFTNLMMVGSTGSSRDKRTHNRSVRRQTVRA